MAKYKASPASETRECVHACVCMCACLHVLICPFVCVFGLGYNNSLQTGRTMIKHFDAMTETIVKMALAQQPVLSKELIAKIRESVSEEVDKNLMNFKATIIDLKKMMHNFIT